MIFKIGNLTLCCDLILAPSLVVVAPSSSVSEGKFSVTERANFCLGGGDMKETSFSISESHVSEQLCISSYSICDVSVRISAS